MKKRFIRSTQKILTVLLAGTMLCSTGIAVSAQGITDNPDDSAVETAEDIRIEGDFEYKVVDGSVTITHYNGNDLDVVIPATIEGLPVTAIGEHIFPERIYSENNYIAYFNNSTVETVTLPDGITEIGECAFSGCHNLKSINIPDGVTKISYQAFSLCDSLESIVIPDSVSELCGHAFGNCTVLSQVKLPYGITEIKEGTFANCSNLKSIDIPDTVTTIGNSAFRQCGFENFDIPEGITTIGDSAFRDCPLENINIPESVTDIEDYAFLGAKIKSISFPDGLEHIGKKVVAACTSLQSFTTPECMTEISESEFIGCASLKEIHFNENIKSIGKKAFCRCSGLESIVIPDHITELGEEVFSNCTGLKSIKLSDNITYIPQWAFKQCTSLTDVTLPKSCDTIGIGAFMECSALETITVPDGTQTMERGAFCYCSSLKYVNLPRSLKTIGNGAFDSCQALTDFVIPYGVKEVGIAVFQSCMNLKTLMIPETVEKFGHNGLENELISYTADCVIYGKTGTLAEKLALENNLRFVPVGDNVPLVNTSAVSSNTISANETVTLNASAEGGTGDYTYALMYKKSTGDKWVKIGTKYGKASTGSFTPKSAVKYDVMINVKDSSGKIKSKTFTVNVKAPLKNKTTVNAESVKVGEKIVLKGAASGGTKGYTYAFYYKKSKNSEWIEMTAPYTSKSCAFKPKSAVSYDVKSVVKDADGRTAETVYKVSATK